MISSSKIRTTVCVVVAGASAVLSASAVHAELLRQHVVADPALASLGVTVYEGGALYLAMLAQERTARGDRALWHRVGFAALLAIAVILNTLHAHSLGAHGVGLVIGGTLPLVLIVTLESAWHERAAARKRAQENSEAAGEAEVQARIDAAVECALAEAERARIEEERRAERERALARERAAEERARRATTQQAAPRVETTPSVPPNQPLHAVPVKRTRQEKVDLLVERLRAGEALVRKSAADLLGDSEGNAQKILAEARAIVEGGRA